MSDAAPGSEAAPGGGGPPGGGGASVTPGRAAGRGGRGIGSAFRDHPRAAAIAAAACLGSSGILFLLSDATPSTATVLRCLYAVPLLWLLKRREDRRAGPRPWAERRWTLLAGVFFAADLVFFHASIQLMGAGLATVMSNLQVVLVTVFAAVAWHERPTRPQMVGVPLALLGVVLITGVLGGGAYGRDPLLGVLLGLLVAASYAGFLLLVRRARDPHHAAGPILDSTLACAITALVAGALVGDLRAPTLAGHAWLALLGVSAQVGAGLLLAVALPRLPAATTSLLLLIQPVLAVLMAMLLLSETPSATQLAGVALVLVGVTLGSLPMGRLAERWRPSRAEAA